MPSPSPSLLLSVAERIDFDHAVRAAVEADPLVVLTAMGLDPDAAMRLAGDTTGEVEEVEGEEGGEVQLFAITSSPIAVQAHRWAMELLRDGTQGQSLQITGGHQAGGSVATGRADVDASAPRAPRRAPG